MIVSIMQPYFFPYLGYFQLMAASDTFVAYDDVQYSKGGWINRNRILVEGRPGWVGLPLAADRLTKPINKRRYAAGRDAFGRVLRQIEAAYRDAPQFDAIFPLIERIMAFPDRNVAAFNVNLLREICAALAIRCELRLSSAIEKPVSLRGEARVIDLCRKLGATRYLNAPGGVELYDAARFAAHGIELAFLQPSVRAYAQGGAPHVPALSIVDAMMFNDAATLGAMLREFSVTVASAQDVTQGLGGGPDLVV